MDSYRRVSHFGFSQAHTSNGRGEEIPSAGLRNWLAAHGGKPHAHDLPSSSLRRRLSDHDGRRPAVQPRGRPVWRLLRRLLGFA